MKLFTIKDFQNAQTAEGASYSNCTMANGLEIQIEQLSWGWKIGVYDIDGRLILDTKQPYMITLAGGVNYDLSNELMLAEISKLYDRVLRRKQILVKSY